MKRLLNLAEYLGLLMLLVSCGAQAGAQPVTQISPLAVETPTASPKVMATPALAELPLCQFNSVPTSTASAPPLGSYVVSEPKVVLTSTGTIGIAQWLPDNERLLLTRDVPGVNRQSVETFNVRDSQTNTYAERERNDAKPVWLSVLNGAAFTSATNKQNELLMSQGSSKSAQQLSAGLSSIFLATDPGGQQLLYLVGNQLQRQEVLSQIVETSSVDLSRWEHPISDSWAIPGMYRMTWRPGTSQAAVYNGYYFFLVDVESSQGCEVDLGEDVGEGGSRLWAIAAQWSPDGRYLAMLTTAGTPPVKRVDLSVLDTVTGKLRSMHPEVYIVPGQYYVMDLAWMPNSQILTTLVTVEERDSGWFEGLYLIDAATGENRRLLPQMTFAGGDAGWNLALSSDGQQLAVTCPTKSEGRLCLIQVESGQ
jgi:dipeptidyl aminopeptidase/acylaminoacyl peptidase